MFPLVAILLALAVSPEGGAVGEAEEVRTALYEVYAEDLFGRVETRVVWVPIRREEEPSARDVRGSASGNLLGMTLLSFATVVGVVLLVMLGAAIWRGRRERATKDTEPESAPTVLFGLDVRPESLPADVIAAARLAWQGGDHLAALSLLYRGALAAVIARAGTRIPRSATEGECVRAVRRAVGEPFGADFEALTSAWLVAAYARRPPPAAEFVALLERWRPHLRPGGRR